MSETKALARYLYSRVPGMARVRFAIKAAAVSHRSKPEYDGASRIESGLIIDVGAFLGESISAFRRLCPNSDIMAFEPEPRAAAHLANRFKRDPKVTLSECALGSETGQKTIFIPQYGYWNCDGMAATDYAEATEWLSDRGRMFRFKKNMLRVREHQVECRTIDSLNKSPVLIKLHAQNAEPDIIKGAVETLKRSSPILMCAFAAPEFIAFVSDLGYSPFTYIDGEFAPGRAPQWVTFTWFLRLPSTQRNKK